MDAFEHRREQIRSQMGGPERIAAVHAEGAPTIRESIAVLTDPGSFEEVGTFAASENPADRAVTPGDGKIGGHATIDGRPVTVAGDDITVKRGSSSVVGGERVARLYLLAERQGNPFVYLGATGGARLPDSLGSEGLAKIPPPVHLGRRQRRVPLATVIVGPSYGGSSFVSALSDFVVQVRGTSLAVTSPGVIQGATGEVISADDLGGPEVHLSRTGQIDLVADSHDEAFALVRRFLSYLPSNRWSRAPRGARADVADDAELPALLPESRRRAYDMRKVLGRVLDEDSWFELRPGFGRSVLTGLGRIDGHSVGVVASQPLHQAGVLTPDSCDKTVRLICLCDAFDIPVVFLQDCPGFLVGSAVEHSRLLYKSVLLLQAMSLARTPRLGVVVRKAFGLAYFTLGGNDMGMDLLCAWPGAEISLMDPEVGAKVVPPDAEPPDFGPMSAAALMKVDEVIHPRETRPVLARALERLDRRAHDPAADRPLASWPTCW
jgi:acetyl-CoA carboxylase carboxyltransferase component